MNKMKDEKIIMESDNTELTLTTHRIRHDTKVLGKANVTSIMLEELCSCSLKYKSNVILLILGILIGGVLIIGSLVSGDESTIAPGVILALIFLGAYFFSKKKILSFSSGGDTINLPVSNISLESAKNFIDEIETAKNDRYLLIK